MEPVAALVRIVSSAVSKMIELFVELSTSRIFSPPSVSKSCPARERKYLWSFFPSGLPGPGTACCPL